MNKKNPNMLKPSQKQGIKTISQLVGGFILIIILGIGLLRYINYKQKYTRDNILVDCLVNTKCINKDATEEEILENMRYIGIPKSIAREIITEGQKSSMEYMNKEDTDPAIKIRIKNSLPYFERALKATEKLEE